MRPRKHRSGWLQVRYLRVVAALLSFSTQEGSAASSTRNRYLSPADGVLTALFGSSSCNTRSGIDWLTVAVSFNLPWDNSKSLIGLVIEYNKLL